MRLSAAPHISTKQPRLRWGAQGPTAPSGAVQCAISNNPIINDQISPACEFSFGEALGSLPSSTAELLQLPGKSTTNVVIVVVVDIADPQVISKKAANADAPA